MTRRVLPDRRPGLRFDLEHGGFDLNVMIGMPEPGEAAEVFVSAHRKIGTPLMASVRDSAILVSLLLQHGCDIGTIAGALTREADGMPASPAGAVVDAMVAQIGDLA
ncbi:hypothetical protein [Enterovirga rhinocerotis]|uniref:Uncharacterized protein n=1 Tax=Enterovirga rhinocerotis TaxID=1339210 RepID=A0A4R7BWP8_9HYPH|nr:hypothetical protein [Enterovirga rhinocerotis]TDR90320.1 hypothetical protein EV668_3168 [Enterovirga rhinocerotis]